MTAVDVPVIAWLSTGDQVTRTVTVRPGQTAEVRLEVTAVAKQDSHTRKDGTPYGRYK